MRDLLGLGTTEARAEHHELVATEPSDDVQRSQGTAEPLRDHPEQRVAGVVAQLVVDRLEPVEIDEQQGHLVRRGRPHEVHCLLELVEQQRPVRQAGEVVVGGRWARSSSRRLWSSSARWRS